MSLGSGDTSKPFLLWTLGVHHSGCDAQPHQPIMPHAGIEQTGDLLAAHDWDGPVVKLTITRISDEAERFRAPLSGAGEVPAVDTEARGQATFRLNEAGTAVHFRLKVKDIDDVTAAHIHAGMPDENGGVVVTLFNGGPTSQNGTLATGYISEANLSGAFAGDFDGFVAALRQGELYVNVHTLGHPAGEIRGQIGATN